MAGEVSADLTGRRLGNYRIEGVLGQGGMSVMYRATDVRLGRKVALKVIGEHLGADAEFRERFVDEARNTSAIDHPNIVPLYDFGELDDMLYIAMRLVDGSDLASLITDDGMGPQRAVGLLDQVADALDTLHERGLVHLDVKPANVLVTSKEAVREHVYIADFGLTRRGTTGHRTRAGDFLGSPTYAAPEHLRGEPLDGRTDQYALGCMLYACLTGKPPFTGDVEAVIKGHLAGEVPSVRTVPGVPAAIDDVVGRGMAKDPDARYDSCVELIAAARAVLAGEESHPTGSPPLPGPSGPTPGTPASPPPPDGARPGPARPTSGPGAPPAPGGPGGSAAGPFPPSAGGAGTPAPGTPAPGTPPPGNPVPGPPAQGRSPYGLPGGGVSPHGAPPAPQYPPRPGSGGPPAQGPPPGQGPPPAYGGPPRGSGESSSRRTASWIVWALAALIVLAAGIVTLVVVLGEDDGGGGTAPTTAGNSPAPEIPIGPGDERPAGTSEVGGTGADGLPPESIPIRPDN